MGKEHQDKSRRKQKKGNNQDKKRLKEEGSMPPAETQGIWGIRTLVWVDKRKVVKPYTGEEGGTRSHRRLSAG